MNNSYINLNIVNIHNIINIFSILEKILWIENFFIQRIHVLPIQKKSIYKIFSKMQKIVAMLLPYCCHGNDKNL